MYQQHKTAGGARYRPTASAPIRCPAPRKHLHRRVRGSTLQQDKTNMFRKSSSQGEKWDPERTSIKSSNRIAASKLTTQGNFNWLKLCARRYESVAEVARIINQ